MNRLLARVSFFSFFFAAISTQLFLSCKTTEITDIIIKTQDFKFDTLFPDGTNVDDIGVEYDQNDKPYIYRKGSDEEGNCRIERYPLHRYGEHLYLSLSEAGERCLGKGCSYCAFKEGGGCECKNSFNICEHEVTKIKDILRFSIKTYQDPKNKGHTIEAIDK